MKQVPYRYPNKWNPCFSHNLCPEELNHLVHLSPARHKIERREMAQKRFNDRGWGMQRKRWSPAHHLVG
jgi:hypothetical protein